MKIDLYTITTLTNLHVGSGDINFDIIDNQVQRDPITTLPNINSSSLKGAFREDFESQEGTKNLVTYIFGPENSDDNSHQTGAYLFFEAQLLSRPVRSNKKAWYSATSPLALRTLLELIENLGIDFDETIKEKLQKLAALKVQQGAPLIFDNTQDVVLEDVTAKHHNFDGIEELEALLGRDIALFADEDFKALPLPVLARNALENGESKNLWYEEFVPKQSRFFFAIGKPDNLDEKDRKEKIEGFENRFNNEGENIQFGANKSIGYGFSKVIKVSK